jgi:hypothetical protein
MLRKPGLNAQRRIVKSAIHPLEGILMKKLVAVLICSLAAAAPAFAGEDSTDHWGPAGTGPSIWESPCGLADFQGNDSPMPEKCRPASYKPASSSQPARSATAPDQSSQYAHSSAAAGATRSDAVVDDSSTSSRGFGAGSEVHEPAETLNDTFHYPSSD